MIKQIMRQIHFVCCTFYDKFGTKKFIKSQCALNVSEKPREHLKKFCLKKKKKNFQNCNRPDFKFHPGKLTNKKICIWCNVKVALLFCIVFIAVKTDSKLTLHHMRKNAII